MVAPSPLYPHNNLTRKHAKAWVDMGTRVPVEDTTEKVPMEPGKSPESTNLLFSCGGWIGSGDSGQISSSFSSEESKIAARVGGSDGVGGQGTLEAEGFEGKGYLEDDSLDLDLVLDFNFLAENSSEPLGIRINFGIEGAPRF